MDKQGKLFADEIYMEKIKKTHSNSWNCSVIKIVSFAAKNQEEQSQE